MLNSTRNGGIAAIVAGVGYLIQAVVILMPQVGALTEYLGRGLEVVFITTLVATILGLIGLHSFARNQYGKAGTIGFWLAIIGAGVMGASTLAALIAGDASSGPSIFGNVFLGGVFASIVGYIVLGTMALRAKVFPLWSGVAFVTGFPLLIFLSPMIGGFVFGLAWLSVGSVLLRQKPELVENSPSP